MNTDNIGMYIAKGSKDIDWYQNTEMLLGELYNTNRKFAARLLAATSINSSLKSNVRLFRRAYHEYLTGAPVGNYLPVMRLQIERVRSGYPMLGRKINSFAAAMSGDVNAVVVDMWLLRAFGEYKTYRRVNKMRSAGATERQYTDIENWVRGYAEMTSREPRQVSAMIWSGIRGGVTRYDDILRHQSYDMFNP